MQIRLFVQVPLNIGQTISLSDEQVHYLRNVLRCEPGIEVYLFNGQDGEYTGVLSALSKKEAIVQVCRQLKKQPEKQNIHLFFAPLKRDCSELVVQKATELGVTKITPVLTEYTSNKHINLDRFKSIVLESCEQCCRLDVPELGQMVDLKTLLLEYDETKPMLVHLDETGQGQKAEVVFKGKKEIAFLTGPEGGFSETERNLIKNAKNTIGLDLGPRILRAETASIAAISLFTCK